MRHLLRRILFYLAAVWASVTMNFFIPRLAPGNPVQIILGNLEKTGIKPSPDMVQSLAASLGIDTTDPIWVQYMKYLGDLLHGNFGRSFTNYPTPVLDIIGQGIMWTIGLGTIAVVIGFVLGSLIGMIAAWKRGTIIDSTLSPALTFLYAIPPFWLALIVVYIFGFSLGWFPFVNGYDIYGPIDWSWRFISSVIDHGFLPALTLVLSSLAGWMLVMRNSMVGVLSDDYVLMANAKGLKQRRVLFTYAARNAILPNIANFALALGFVVSGQVVTEIVFSYPGIGDALFIGVQNHDYPLIQAAFLFIALGVLGANFLADMLYAVLDPRVRVERSA
ncbi:MAG TPA: ABC transporter permease [Ktedonobacteraceae bacterium]|jgi:peptide/nickel transport system permease protein|nr:ABC transporter permease [Ktedonobacteraceae bacterium]